MSTGLQILLGVCIGVVLFVVFRRRLVGTDKEPPAPQKYPADEVSDETIDRMKALIADGKAMLAIKAVRDDTGWDLLRSKKFVDRYR